MPAGRLKEPELIDPVTYPLEEVCLTTAARFLGMNPRTLRRRITDGRITAIRDGKVYRLAVWRLAAYKRSHINDGLA